MFCSSDLLYSCLQRDHLLMEYMCCWLYCSYIILFRYLHLQESYNSFIDLQDKLHHNLCRRRSLVAIGTHDFDTLQGPFLFDALPPTDIKFIALNQVRCEMVLRNCTVLHCTVAYDCINTIEEEHINLHTPIVMTPIKGMYNMHIQFAQGNIILQIYKCSD